VLENGGIDLPQRVIQVLYRDATIFLDRKRTSASELAQAKVRKFDRIGVTKEQLEALYTQHQSWVVVANELGVSIRYVHYRKRLFGIT
jgi:adenosyl cobinamide kinase/adenosyl cobinamide phosphate guanylyltransferase